jgi:CspA family cold shock protein
VRIEWPDGKAVDCYRRRSDGILGVYDKPTQRLLAEIPLGAKWRTATVREWRDADGWGVVAADGFPDAIWVHFSAIQAEGNRSLTEGDRVEVMIEGPLDQDGYRYRASAVRTFGSQGT